MHYATKMETEDGFGTKRWVLGTKGIFLTRKRNFRQSRKPSYSEAVTAAKSLLWYTRHPHSHG